MYQIYIAIAFIFHCSSIVIESSPPYAGTVESCTNRGKKHGCFEVNAIDKSTLLVDWRGYIKWEDFRTFINKLSCTCAEEAAKHSAAGFALFWWGQCFVVSIDEIVALESSDRSSACFKGDGSYTMCKDDHSDVPCIGDDTAVYIYNMASVDGGFSEWSEWSTCSKECGSGMRSQRRTCNEPRPALGGAPCDGERKRAENCNAQPCSVDGGFGQWGGWGICTKSCGGGFRKRSRECNNPQPLNNGKPCGGDADEAESCGEESCPVDGGFKKWGEWGECSLSCGGGTTFRRRFCNSHGGKECEGSWTETKDCNQEKCPANGGFSEWSTWSACTASCGLGEHSRRQTCVHANLCSGERVEKEACGEIPCPVNGGYSQWSSWTQCSKECGTGSTIRHRFCNKPVAQYGGIDCEGVDSEEKSCVEKSCPVNGNWGPWLKWTKCSKPCGQGIRHRARKCNDPEPTNGGIECPGGDKEIATCLVKKCAQYSGWSNWGAWSACHKKCGRGRKRRYRKCVGNKKCKGKRMQKKKCHTKCFDPYPYCSLSNKRSFFKSSTPVRRALRDGSIIPRIGKQYIVTFSFIARSLRPGALLQVRAKSKHGHRMPLIKITAGGNLKVQVPANGKSRRELYLPKIRVGERYRVTVSQVKGKANGKYVVTASLFDGKKLQKKTFVNNHPNKFSIIKVWAVPGWWAPADVSIKGVTIHGICRPGKGN